MDNIVSIKVLLSVASNRPHGKETEMAGSGTCLPSFSVRARPTSAQNAPLARLDSSQVIQFLNQTIDWYRHRAAEQQIATEPDDVLVVNDNRQLADQVVRLAFDFAQAEAESLPRAVPRARTRIKAPARRSIRASLQLEAKINQQAQEAQAEVDTLRLKLETATGKKRQELQAQLAETQAELELAKARKDAIHSMTEFVSGTGSNGLGATDLRAQIQALAESVPVALTAKASEASSKEQLSPALIAATNSPAPSGIWDLTADLFALSRKIHTVDAAIQQTDALAKQGRGNPDAVREPH